MKKKCKKKLKNYYKKNLRILKITIKKNYKIKWMK